MTRKREDILADIHTLFEELEEHIPEQCAADTYEGGCTITDHAVVRYLERIAGMDIPQLRRQLESELMQFIAVGCNRVKRSEGIYVIADNRVVTVYDPKGE